MSEQIKKGKARPEGETGPESGTALAKPLKGKGDNLSSDFYYDDEGNYLARFSKGVVYYRKTLNSRPLSGDKVAEVNLWAVKKNADIIHKVDDSDFVAHDAGGDKLIENLKDFIAIDVPPTEVELNKITQELGVTAFHYVKELVPLLDRATKYFHANNLSHNGDFKNCLTIVCSNYRTLMSKINENLFHGTLEDLTGVKP